MEFRLSRYESIDRLGFTRYNVFSEYCKFWQLKVNVEKTKILVFSRGRLPNNLTFTFNEMEIGIVSEFNYLGVLLSKSGNFSMAKKAQVEKATKAMFEVLKRGKVHNLSIQCQLDLFDKIIKPILLINTLTLIPGFGFLIYSGRRGLVYYLSM